MARRSKAGREHTGLYHAREARGMSRSDLVRVSGVSKQQLSRLENGQIRLRLDHLKPFAPHLGYTPEQMLLWGRYPGTEKATGQKEPTVSAATGIPELDRRETAAGGGKSGVRKDGRHKDPLKAEQWVFPNAFVREQLHASPEGLLVMEVDGDSMAPTLSSGERVIVDTEHRTPSPDGLYAVRNRFGVPVVRRLHVLQSSRSMHIKVIADNPKHPSEETLLEEIEIVGKVLCGVKLF